MDSYIVRIYRRGMIGGKELAGLVERIGGGTRRAFGNRDELWSFLTDTPAKPGTPGRKGGRWRK